MAVVVASNQPNGPGMPTVADGPAVIPFSAVNQPGDMQERAAQLLGNFESRARQMQSGVDSTQAVQQAMAYAQESLFSNAGDISTYDYALNLYRVVQGYNLSQGDVLFTFPMRDQKTSQEMVDWVKGQRLVFRSDPLSTYARPAFTIQQLNYYMRLLQTDYKESTPGTGGNARWRTVSDVLHELPVEIYGHADILESPQTQPTSVAMQVYGNELANRLSNYHVDLVKEGAPCELQNVFGAYVREGAGLFYVLMCTQLETDPFPIWRWVPYGGIDMDCPAFESMPMLSRNPYTNKTLDVAFVRVGYSTHSHNDEAWKVPPKNDDWTVIADQSALSEYIDPRTRGFWNNLFSPQDVSFRLRMMGHIGLHEFADSVEQRPAVGPNERNSSDYTILGRSRVAMRAAIHRAGFLPTVISGRESEKGNYVRHSVVDYVVNTMNILDEFYTHVKAGVEPEKHPRRTTKTLKRKRSATDEPARKRVKLDSFVASAPVTLDDDKKEDAVSNFAYADLDEPDAGPSDLATPDDEGDSDQSNATPSDLGNSDDEEDLSSSESSVSDEDTSGSGAGLSAALPSTQPTGSSSGRPTGLTLDDTVNYLNLLKKELPEDQKNAIGQLTSFDKSGLSALFTFQNIPGDGNCQFASVAAGLRDLGFESTAKETRKDAVEYLNDRISLGSSTDEWDALRQLAGDTTPRNIYLQNMAIDGVWGDNFTLVAMVETYGLSVVLIRSDTQDAYSIVSESPLQRYGPIYLWYTNDNHYDLLIPNDGTVFKNSQQRRFAPSTPSTPPAGNLFALSQDQDLLF